jgi:hypothetical protein
LVTPRQPEWAGESIKQARLNDRRGPGGKVGFTLATDQKCGFDAVAGSGNIKQARLIDPIWGSQSTVPEE